MKNNRQLKKNSKNSHDKTVLVIEMDSKLSSSCIDHLITVFIMENILNFHVVLSSCNDGRKQIMDFPSSVTMFYYIHFIQGEDMQTAA